MSQLLTQLSLQHTHSLSVAQLAGTRSDPRAACKTLLLPV